MLRSAVQYACPVWLSQIFLFKYTKCLKKINIISNYSWYMYHYSSYHNFVYVTGLSLAKCQNVYEDQTTGMCDASTMVQNPWSID